MRIGVIIPDRGDRKKFLAHCKWLISRQTVKPELVYTMNEPALSDKCDITYRYRKGYELMSLQPNLDCILLMENDDWYAPDYIETMTREWERHGRPDIFGTNYTIYYNINLHAWLTMNHKRRSSAMSTLIKPGLEIEWPEDHEPYTDIALWKKVEGGVTFKPTKHICLGIKHGVGLCGGRGHTTRLHRYDNQNAKPFLKGIVDAKSYQLYTNFKPMKNLENG